MPIRRPPRRWLALVAVALIGGAAFHFERPVDASSATAERRAIRRALSRQLTLPETPFAYVAAALPDHVDAGTLRRFDNTPRSNRQTDAGVALGRALFYDPLLSATGTLSCASCHDQSRAFAEKRRRSVGVHGRRGGRNAMSLVNLRYHASGGFFWDERSRTLEDQVLQPIQDHREMALPREKIVARVSSRDAYPALFEAAFGSRTITEERVAKALAQFVRALTSFGSKYDIGLARVESVAEPFPNFTQLENDGKDIFFGGGRQGRCASCHTVDRRRGPRRRTGVSRPALFLGRFATNNGLDRDVDVKDRGVGGRTGDEDAVGDFKTPSLRNVEKTAPYMHDGRLRTLEDVIDHYAREVQPHPNLDRRLRGRGGGSRVSLTSRERRALVAFLKTLTDRGFLADPRFGDPFR